MIHFLTDRFLALGIDPALGGVVLGAVLGWVACSLRPVPADSMQSPLAHPQERQSPVTQVPAAATLTSHSTSHRIAIDLDGQELILEGDQADEFFKALRTGEKISAIRILREATGLGLKEAKDLVEAMDVSRLQGRV